MPIKNKGNYNLSDVVKLQIANDWPTAQVTYTSDVIESASNLYFTTARVNATVQPFLTTANVIETSGNLYFTAARVNATVQPFLTTANVIETSGNLYFTNTKVFNAITIGTITGDIAVTGNLFANGLIIQDVDVTNNILAGNINVGTSTSNIIVTDSITSNIWNGLYTANVIETAGNLYFTYARVNATVQPFLTTANVIETSGNLYFTNARVISALIAGNQIIIEANGRISANVVGASGAQGSTNARTLGYNLVFGG